MKRKAKWLVLALFISVFSTINCFASSATNLKGSDYLDKYEVIYQNMVDKVKYTEKTGDLNIDFLFYMLSYEQFGAEMSKSELRFGANDRVKDVVNSIVKENKNHIKNIEKLLKTMVKNPVIDEAKEGVFLEQFNQVYEEMLIGLQLNRENSLQSVDQDYLEKVLVYLDYEQRFASLILTNSDEEQIVNLAQKIISNQATQVEKINEILEQTK